MVELVSETGERVIPIEMGMLSSAETLGLQEVGG